MLKYRIWEKYKKRLQGIFYAGPYIIRGTLMALRDNHFEPEMPILDAHITCLTAGTSWDDLHAPFVLLNRQWLVGYQPD